MESAIGKGLLVHNYCCRPSVFNSMFEKDITFRSRYFDLKGTNDRSLTQSKEPRGQFQEETRDPFIIKRQTESPLHLDDLCSGEADLHSEIDKLSVLREN